MYGLNVNESENYLGSITYGSKGWVNNLFWPHWSSWHLADVWSRGSEIVAINDLTSPEMLATFLKYDTTQGNYSHHKVATDHLSSLISRDFSIYKEADADNLLWGDLNVDVVLECTGFYTLRTRHRLTSTLVLRRLSFRPAGNDLQPSSSC